MRAGNEPRLQIQGESPETHPQGNFQPSKETQKEIVNSQHFNNEAD